MNIYFSYIVSQENEFEQDHTSEIENPPLPPLLPLSPPKSSTSNTPSANP